MSLLYLQLQRGNKNKHVRIVLRIKLQPYAVETRLLIGYQPLEEVRAFCCKNDL